MHTVSGEHLASVWPSTNVKIYLLCLLSFLVFCWAMQSLPTSPSPLPATTTATAMNNTLEHTISVLDFFTRCTPLFFFTLRLFGCVCVRVCVVVRGTQQNKEEAGKKTIGQEDDKDKSADRVCILSFSAELNCNSEQQQHSIVYQTMCICERATIASILDSHAQNIIIRTNERIDIHHYYHE